MLPPTPIHVWWNAAFVWFRSRGPESKKAIGASDAPPTLLHQSQTALAVDFLSERDARMPKNYKHDMTHLCMDTTTSSIFAYTVQTRVNIQQPALCHGDTDPPFTRVPTACRAAACVMK